MMQGNKKTEVMALQPWRVWIIYIFIAFVVGAIMWRLFNLQIVETEGWRNRAETNFTRTVSVPAPRGIIYDRNGFILARNVASYNVVIVPAALPDEAADTQRIYRTLSELIDVPINRGTLDEAKLYAECVPGPGITQLVELGRSLAPYRPVKISCSIDETLARIIQQRAVDWPGVSVQIDPIREYPTGSLTSNVVGFLGPIPANLADVYEELGFVAGRDKVGYAGVELSFQEVLTGTNGRRVIEVDVAEKELRNLEAPVEPQPGNNIMLTIDTRLQAAAEAALLENVEFWNTWFNRVRISSGSVIAMNPKTGEVMAMVTYPTYENNRMARFIPTYYFEQLSEDPRRPMLNTAISSEFPPGSVFKLTTAVGALNEGVVSLSTIVQTPGKLTLTEKFSPNDPGFQRDFVDWIYERNGVINEAGFGSLDFRRCIAYSSNVCFYKLGGGYSDEIEEGLGVLRLYEYSRALGFDEPSGIELPGEQDGLIPTPRWKRINQGENWSTGDTYIASVGQGYVLSTPLQILISAAIIANDGKYMQPTIIREIVDGEGKVAEKWLNSDGTISTRPSSDESRRISPFTPHLKWDVTLDKLIRDYDCTGDFCRETGTMKVIEPFVLEAVQQGMRLAVTDSLGTLNDIFSDYSISVAGKTGTAEYCDDVAMAANRCQFGAWPTHAWTVAYAPYDDPEIVVVAFAYNGGEGGSVAAPIVNKVIRAYFELKAADIALRGGGQLSAE